MYGVVDVSHDGGPGRSYAVAPDGQRLLVAKPVEPDRSTAIQVVSNWTAFLD